MHAKYLGDLLESGRCNAVRSKHLVNGKSSRILGVPENNKSVVGVCTPQSSYETPSEKLIEHSMMYITFINKS